MATIRTIQDISDEIETVLDKTTMDCFIEALALCCSTKADHIRANWQDERTAKAWDRYATVMLQAKEKLFST